MRAFAIFMIFVVLAPITASAGGLTWVKQVIYGMDCAPCAYGIEKGLKELDGVASVTVSLNDGYAEVQLDEQNTVTLAAIREVILKNGFTPKAAQVRIRGRLTYKDGSDELVLETTGALFRLTATAAALPAPESFFGRVVEVIGTVPAAGAEHIRITAVRAVEN